MRTRILPLTLFLLLLPLFPLHGQTMQTESFRGREVVAQEVIVRFRAQDSAQRRIKAASVSAQDADVESSEPVGNSGSVRIRSHGRNVAALIQAYAARSDVEYAEPNYIWHASDFPNDLSLGQQWALSNTGQKVDGQFGTAGADIKAIAAWGITPGSRSIVVGVIDSGVFFQHKDLVENMWFNTTAFSFTIGGVTKTCPAFSRGYNGITNSCFTNAPQDDHGTHVAGIVGATGNNGYGVTGVSPSVQLMDLTFLDKDGFGTTADAIRAIEFAIQAKAALGAAADVRILNASWAGFNFSQALLDEITLAGNPTNKMLFVAAAGNDNQNIDSIPEYPAAFNAANIVTVTATDNRDNLASFSNFGTTSVDIAAPGVDIYSTVRSDSFAYFSGTSMAAPMVSGAAALILSACPNLDVSQLRAVLLAPTAVDVVPSLIGKVATSGRLNVLKALQTCGAMVPAADFRLGGVVGFPAVVVGKTLTATISLTSIGSFSDTVNLTLKLPTGINAVLTSTTLSPSSPTAYLVITPDSGAGSGNYVVGVTGTANGITRTTGVEVVTSILQTLNFSSELNTNFYRLPGSPETYLAFFGFAVNNRSVTINVKSTEFDTVAYILDANGNLVASNHGGGGGYNSRIAMTLPVGTYFLQVLNAVPGQVGAYSVSSDLVLISSISPASGRQNASTFVTFTGIGFTPGMFVDGGAGISATDVFFENANTIRANLNISTAAAFGGRGISLVDGLGGTNPIPFTVLPPAPIVTSVSPASGPTESNLVVTLTGQFLVAPGTVQAFYGPNAIPVSNVAFNSDTSVTATVSVPKAVYSTSSPIVAIRVQTAGGLSNALPIAMVPPPPIITSLIEKNVFQGVATASVAIQGMNLFPDIVVNAGAGISAVAIVSNGSATSQSIILNISAGAAPGPRSFSLTTPGGTSNTVSINVQNALPPPTVTSITPASGHAGLSYNVTITGTNLGGPITVNAGTGVTFSALQAVNGNSVVGSVNIQPNATLGVRNITLSTAWGTTASFQFNVLPILISLDSISPPRIGPGMSKTLRLKGNNFTVGMRVTVTGGGISAGPATVFGSQDADVSFTTSSSAALGPRTVTLSDASSTSDPMVLTVVPRPVLTAITPNIAKRTVPTTVALTGSNFLIPSLTVDGGFQTVINVLSITDNMVTVTVNGIGTNGTKSFSVITDGGTSNSLPFEIVTPQPIINAMSSAVFRQDSVQSVNLTGINFTSPLSINAGTDITVSNLNIISETTASATFTVASNAQPGNRQLLISNQYGASNSYSLTIVPQSPSLTAVTPARGGQGSTVHVTLTGTNLFAPLTIDAGTGVTVGGVTLLNAQALTAIFTIAANAPIGIVPLTVTTSGGASIPLPFTVDPPSLTIRVSGTGRGKVTSSPPGIDCGPTCTITDSNGQVFALAASPSPDSVFAGWSGDADCTDGSVTMTASRDCVARFDLPQANSTLLRGDYDGDGKTDIAVYRPSTGEWFLRLSTQGYMVAAGDWNFQWGVPGDVPLSGDFDGDGKSDISVYRPSTGEWFIRYSMQNYVIAAGSWYFQWGAVGDVPITGDFDGDGKTDISVYRAATGEWFIRHSSLNYAIAAGNWLFQWGVPGDQPLASDFDGDGRTDIAVFRPATGEWFIRLSSRNYAIASGPWYYLFGNSAFQPVPGDYDGDRKTDLAVYRPATGEWFLRLSTLNYDVTSGNMLFQWGIPEDLPLKGDFDGDGQADIAVYRPPTGEWFLRLSTQGYAIAQGNWYFQWGVPGDLPFRR